MTIEGTENNGKSSGGPPKARAICDDCGHEDLVACGYSRSHKPEGRKPNEGQVKAKVMAMGWSYVKGKLRCPECEARRKVVPMKPKDTEDTGPAREMKPKEKIQIYAMLAEVYDLDNGHYIGGETDDSVADVLGVMPGWVSAIREADFGPDGSNDDTSALSDRIDEMRNLLAAESKQLDLFISRHKSHTEELDAMKAELERIKGTLSRRVRKTAGV